MRAFTFTHYLRDHWCTLFLGAFCLFGIAVMLAVMGLSVEAIGLAAFFILILLIAGLLVDFNRRRIFWQQIQETVERAARPGDMTAFVEEPAFLEGELAFDALEKLTLLSNGMLSAAQEDAQAYREYIELWIHETKTPLAAAKLMVQRMQGEDAAVLSNQLERIERQIDQALYYARSTAVENDYEIREVALANLCREACKRNARFLTEKHCVPTFDIPETLEVLTDEPWMLFMLGQIIANAAKYDAHSIRFSATVEEEGTPRERTTLSIADDGCGISEADMPRIFDRGFTGTNGRTSGTATGMGLYLVAKMCDSLGLGVQATSEEGAGTRILFTFPHNRRL